MTSTVTIDSQGNELWCNEVEELHRTDGPAVVRKDGSREWWLDGKRHRNDGPAVENADGSQEWWINDQLHRTDGPAVDHGNAYKAWYIHDRLHRTDGPAVIKGDGSFEFWIDGKILAPEKFFEQRDQMEAQQREELNQKLIANARDIFVNIGTTSTTPKYQKMQIRKPTGCTK